MTDLPYPLVPEVSANMQTGRAGEVIARAFLRTLGYKILEVNVRIGEKDEIDIVAYDPEDKVIVFAEVKTRRRKGNDFHPELNMTHLKKAAMIRSSRRWVRLHEWEGGYRMDAVFIVGKRVTQHIKELSWDRRSANRL